MGAITSIQLAGLTICMKFSWQECSISLDPNTGVDIGIPLSIIMDIGIPFSGLTNH